MKKELIDAVMSLDTTASLAAAAVFVPPMDSPLSGVLAELEDAKRKRLEGYARLQDVVEGLITDEG
jgi:hypothetical protein